MNWFLVHILGGSEDGESATKICLDLDGNVYISGRTYSKNFPTINPFQSVFGGGLFDAFITKFNSLEMKFCTALIWGEKRVIFVEA